MIQVLIQKLDASLPLPFYATEGSSGIDLYSGKEAILEKSSHILMPTGIKMQIPQGYEGQVRPRSGLALNHQITVLNSPGTIDASYRGEIKVILINFGKQDFKIEKGMRIAQLVICPVVEASLVLVENLNENTTRGSGGFGSTGL